MATQSPATTLLKPQKFDTPQPTQARSMIFRKFKEALEIRYELARFHTCESYLVCYPAIWGACLTISHQHSHPHDDPSQSSASSSTSPTSPSLFTVLPLLLALCLSMTLTHGTFCTLNDILDASLDAQIPRTRSRPIPSGRISRPQAFLSFLILLGITCIFIHLFLGDTVFLLMLPSMLVSAAYPYAKRAVHWPQFVLAPACGWVVFVGAGAVTGAEAGGGVATVTLFRAHLWPDMGPLFLGFCTWAVFFDTCYALQDAENDKEQNNGSLAVLLGDRIKPFLAFLGVLQISFLVQTARQLETGWVFWVFGVGWWAVSIPVSLKVLDLQRPESGGRVFAGNIMLGMWISAVAVGEMAVRLGWGKSVGLKV